MSPRRYVDASTAAKLLGAEVESDALASFVDSAARDRGCAAEDGEAGR